MTLYNYFNLRWAEGYSYVSDAPNQYNILVESQVGSGVSAEEGGSVEVIYDAPNRLYLGVLKCNLFLSVLGRHAAYQHVVIIDQLAPEQQFDLDCLIAVLRQRYGDDIERAVAELYNRLTVLSKAVGREQLRPFELSIAQLLRQRERQAPTAAVPTTPAVAPAPLVTPAPVVVAAPAPVLAPVPKPEPTPAVVAAPATVSKPAAPMPAPEPVVAQLGSAQAITPPLVAPPPAPPPKVSEPSLAVAATPELSSEFEQLAAPDDLPPARRGRAGHSASTTGKGWAWPKLPKLPGLPTGGAKSAASNVPPKPKSEPLPSEEAESEDKPVWSMPALGVQGVMIALLVIVILQLFNLSRDVSTLKAQMQSVQERTLTLKPGG